jgi:putative methyltransferase (TIGR04325 family)
MISANKLIRVSRSYFSRTQKSNQSKANSIHWTGDYDNWNDAIEESDGYNSESILAKLADSTRKILKGDALFERDSFLFHEPDWNWPLLSSLFLALSDPLCSQKVVDFGGSLGSIYFQNKSLFEHLPDVRWQVVEQSHIAALGQLEFADNVLSFVDSLKAVNQSSDGILILSGVLQYLREPHEILNIADRMDFRYIILDRTAFIDEENHLITIQHVPDWIYRGSYPCWFFNEAKLLSPLITNYNQVFHFPSKYDCRVSIDGSRFGQFKGFLMKRKG